MEAHQKEKTIEDELFEALVIENNMSRVMELCGKAEEGPLHKITIQKDTVLHMAVHTEQADLVLELVKALPENEDSIIGAVNDGGNTILHEVAISDKLVGAAEEMLRKAPELLDSPCWRLPWWEAIRKEDKKYYSALKLAKLLIERDTSWKKTEDLRENRIGGEASSDDPLNEEDKKNGENCIGTESSSSSEPLHKDNKKDQKNEDNKRTPLLLATKYGCEGIVEDILKRFPRAIEHVDDKGQTILHIAIKHRQMAIFDMRVQNICSAHFFRYINNDKETAEKLFAETNVTLRGKAEEWLKNTAQNSSIIAVLIATVAFAAAYTVPGGSDAETGVPILVEVTVGDAAQRVANPRFTEWRRADRHLRSAINATIHPSLLPHVVNLKHAF
ncbi:hypothetical protein F0562_008391 [Nyssa sinensis]|uniref:PGG domain-containing protein n=1 Tax=Nyssa sinensis TaxID=561372 RepID=A0A5J5A9B2_9ASTE|nr:hypothetical protein F0562_008391 [Nyssa sinensis]